MQFEFGCHNQSSTKVETFVESDFLDFMFQKGNVLKGNTFLFLQI